MRFFLTEARLPFIGRGAGGTSAIFRPGFGVLELGAPDSAHPLKWIHAGGGGAGRCGTGRD